MRVYHQYSSQPYVPPNPKSALFPVKSFPDVIDTLATSIIRAAPAKITQVIRDNNNKHSEINSPIAHSVVSMCIYIMYI